MAKKTIKDDLITSVSGIGKLADNIDGEVEKITKKLDAQVDPVRKSAFRRFPVLFTLLVAFGATATFLAFENILLQYEVLNRYPWLILLIGIVTLIMTGKLFKALD